MKESNDRILQFDFLRAVAIMYIIGVRHLDDYVSGYFHCKIDDILTFSFLGLFVFISGFLLSINNNIESQNGIIFFLKKRFLRIYPLYIVALFLFYLGHLVSIKELLAGGLLLNTIFEYRVPTLWYVSIICVYYLLFPLLSYQYRWYRIFVVFTLFMFISVLLNKYIGIIDIRLILYFPLFVSGIFLSKFHDPINVLTNKVLVIVSAIIFYISSAKLFEFHDTNYEYIFILLVMLTSIPLLFFISGKFTIIFDNMVVKKIAFSSYCMYLFHRLIFYTVVLVYKPDTDFWTLVYLYAIAIPLIFIFSFGVQRGYDFLLKRCITV